MKTTRDNGSFSEFLSQYQTYNKWFYFLYFPLSAIAAVHIGNDNSFLALLQIPSYYTDLGFALFCSLAIGAYLAKLYRNLWKEFLDEREQHGQKPIWKKIVMGIFLPLFVISVSEIFYLVFILDIPLSQSSMFYLEMPVSALFLLVANLYYLLGHFNLKTEFLKNNLLYQPIESEILSPSPRSFKNSFLVNKGSSNLLINTEDIAYFLLENKLTFLVTRKGERYLVNEPLAVLQDYLDPQIFFQINRQVLAHHNSIQSFEQTETRKLKVHVSPSIAEVQYVSKAKAKQFVNWLQTFR